jgi:hypothetical protein
MSFDPDQERDEAGRFAGGGSSSGSERTAENRTESLTSYQNYGYQTVNEELRGGKMSDATRQKVEDIDALINEEKAGDFVGYRGDGAALSAALFEDAQDIMGGQRISAESLFGQHADIEDALNERLKGMEFVDRAFMSTSQDKEMTLEKFVPGAYEITEYGGSGFVEIYGADVKSLNVDDRTKMGAKESERLLARGTALKVERVQIKPHPDGKRVYLHWQVRVVK